MTITRNQVTTVMLMIVVWVVVAWWLIGCDRTIYVSNLDDASAAESTPSASPTNQLPTTVEEERWAAIFAD